MSTTEEKIRLTPKQAEAMKWLRGGWKAYGSDYDTSVEINGKAMFRLATMEVLERLDLAERHRLYGKGASWSRPYWIATPKGKSYQP